MGFVSRVLPADLSMMERHLSEATGKRPGLAVGLYQIRGLLYFSGIQEAAAFPTNSFGADT